MTGLLVQRVEPMSAAHDAGIERGSIILEINRQPVDSVARLPPRPRKRAQAGEALAVFIYIPEIDQKNIKTVDRVTGRSIWNVDTIVRCVPSPYASMKPRILVIDDEAAIRDSLKMILEYEGYEVLTAATGEDGIAQGRARGARPRLSRRQDAGHGRPRGAAAAPPPRRSHAQSS